MDTHFALARAERLSPLVASRVSAYAAIAMYEGLVPAFPDLQSLQGQLNGLDTLPSPDAALTYDWTTVAVTAQSTVFKTMLAEGFPASLNSIDALADSQIAARAEQGIPVPVIKRSTAYGTTLATAITKWAADDGFIGTRRLAYEPPKGRQHWIPTATADQHTAQSLSAVSDYVSIENPAAVLDAEAATERALLMNRPRLRSGSALVSINPTRALEPYWGRIRPLVLASADQCAPPQPAPYSEDLSSAFYKEVKAVYQASKTLTPEQRAIAFFWADNPGQTGTPAGHWVSIMSQLVAQLDLDAARTSEMFVLNAIAIADAFVSCWQEKYRSNVPRPITTVRRMIDPEWQTLVATPPFPEYTSGHSVQSGASAEVLTELFGDIPFSDNTQVSLGHPVKRFSSFRNAAREAAVSRLYGGIHYPMAIENGVPQGQCVGRAVLQRVKTRKQK